jgi:two-component system sensor histidine kinase PilS (NtrC family)
VGRSGPELRRKLAWLIGIRAVLSTLLLGGATVAQIAAPGSFPGDPFFLLIAVTFALTAAYAWALRYIDRHPWLIDVQFALDAITVSAFIYLTGGIASVFASVYVLPIIAASTVRSRRGALLVATLSAALFTGLVTWQYATASSIVHDAWFGGADIPLPQGSVAQYRLALNVSGLFAVGLLSGSLAESERSAGAKLAQASTQIAGLQALNQHVIDSLPSGLATTDRARRVLTFNHAAETITGLSFASVVGQPLIDVLRMPPALVDALEEGLRGSGARRLEFAFRKDDGQEIEVGLGATYLGTPHGPAGLLVTFQDVTEFKKLELDVRLKQRLAAVGEMAAGIAHEIRNPLASMSGSIQILRQELALNAEQEQLMDIVLRESERLNTTIGSFLAYARPQRFAVSRFDLRRALNDTAFLLRNSADVLDGHTIDVELPDHELWYEADEGQMKQIVWNLATNGLRAMPNGGRLHLRASGDTTSVVMTVRDDGIGIPREELDQMFQPFHSSFDKGTGLGLAIVHRIVTDYHGDIEVTSQPGAGTTVSVRLPVRVEAVVA